MVRLNFALPRFFEVRFSIGDCLGGVDRDSVLVRRMPTIGTPTRGTQKKVSIRNIPLFEGREGGCGKRIRTYPVLSCSGSIGSEELSSQSGEKRVGDCRDTPTNSRDDL